MNKFVKLFLTLTAALAVSGCYTMPHTKPCAPCAKPKVHFASESAKVPSLMQGFRSRCDVVGQRYAGPGAAGTETSTSAVMPNYFNEALVWKCRAKEMTEYFVGCAYLYDGAMSALDPGKPENIIPTQAASPSLFSNLEKLIWAGAGILLGGAAVVVIGVTAL